LHIDLNEGAGQLFLFPRRRRLARPQPHHDVFPADRLAGVKHHVLNESIALVEDCDHRNPLRHWRHPGRTFAERPGGMGLTCRCRAISVARPAAAGKRDRGRGGKQDRAAELHCYSGIQGW
jgi:hypothetical protein